jgi:hypothetical protein
MVFYGTFRYAFLVCLRCMSLSSTRLMTVGMLRQALMNHFGAW